MFDQWNQMVIRVLFEDLFARLQTCKAHDIIRILDKKFPGEGLKAYTRSNIIQVNDQRRGNNLFMVGQALRNLLTEGKFYFTNPELRPYKNFIEREGIQTRARIASLVRGQKTPLETKRYDIVLVQQTIEHALELESSNCTIPLRDVIYIHNQLCHHGRDYIFLKGFEHGLDKKEDLEHNVHLNPTNNPDSEAESGGEDQSMDNLSDGQSEAQQDHPKEMDPL